MSKIEKHYNKAFQGRAVRVDAVNENGDRLFDPKTDTYYGCKFFLILNEGDELSEQYLLGLRHLSPSGHEDGVLVLNEPYGDGASRLEKGGWWYAKTDSEDGGIFKGHKLYHITFVNL